MTQERRSLLAGLLSLAVLAGWYYFFEEKRAPVQESARVTEEKPPLAPSDPARSPTPKSDRSESQGPEKRLVRETPRFILEWTDRGGLLSDIRVPGYHQGVGPKSPPINLLPFEEEKGPLLLCKDCNFSLPADGAYSLVSEAENSIEYEAGAQGAGVVVRKRYEWDDRYLLNLRVTVENRSDREIRGRMGVGWRARQFLPEGGSLQFLKGPGNQRQFLYKTGKDVVRGGPKEEVREVQGPTTWAGIEDRYFLIALISRKVSSGEILRLQEGAGWLDFSLYSGEMSLYPGSRQEENYSFYLGPKRMDFLRTAGVGLEEAIDYGWFSLIAVPILKLLQLFHSWVHNWGVAIILLTLFVKLLMNPLTLKSMGQMKEMQRLQPQLAALKEKYKEDRQRLNTETMQLFKTHKVNPMGGCLPILLQMPIYIALYKVLYNSVELYHAPFFGFYRDLSAPDPYFILPILLGVSMVAQQKLTPSPSADPAQRQMMMIMPVMFTAFMLFLPVGLVVYIFVNTVTSVLQQWMHQKGIRWRDVLKGNLKLRKS